MRLLATLLLLVVLPGCGGDPAVEAPRVFPAVTDDVPAGWREELCPGSSVTVRLVVPPALEHGHTERDGCGWSAAQVGRGMGVTVGPKETLAEWRKALDRFAGSQGDDSVEDIEYDEDVLLFGDRRGESLEWYAFNDGSPTRTRSVQTAGVRVQWSTPADTARGDDSLRRVLRSVAVIDGAWHQCSSGTTRVRFQLPPVADRVESFRGQCRVTLKDALSVVRRAEVTVRPKRSLAEQALGLRGRPGISRITLEPDTATLLGRKVERLSWLVTRRPTDPDDTSPAGTWRVVRVGDARVQVTWGATPAQWEAEHAVVERFLASVRLP